MSHPGGNITINLNRAITDTPFLALFGLADVNTLSEEVQQQFFGFPEYQYGRTGGTIANVFTDIVFTIPTVVVQSVSAVGPGAHAATRTRRGAARFAR